MSAFVFSSFYGTGKFADFNVISCDGRTFKLHKVILSGISNKLRNMLDDESCEMHATQSGYTLDQMFNWIYKGDFQPDRLIDYKNLWRAAKDFEIDPLAEHCLMQIRFCLNIENAIEVSYFARTERLMDLDAIAREFIIRNFKLVQNSRGWRLMNDMRFKDLLMAQYVNAMENRLELALLNKALMKKPAKRVWSEDEDYDYVTKKPKVVEDIHIKIDSCGKMLLIQQKPNCKIILLRKIIRDLTGMALAHQRLFQGAARISHDDWTLSDYNIKNGSTLELFHMVGQECSLGCKV